LLGHFRHEIGHYFWNVLVRADPCLEAFRAVFGVVGLRDVEGDEAVVVPGQHRRADQVGFRRIDQEVDYFWNVLVRADPCLEAFRAVFGDERADYGAALQRHYVSTMCM
jgi:hypothetical protein